MHGNQKAVLQRCAAAVHVGDVGHPRRHELRGVSLREAFLDLQPIEGLGVVGRPEFFDPPQNAEVDAPPTSRARLDLELRMFRAQSVDNLIEIHDILHPQLAFLSG